MSHNHDNQIISVMFDSNVWEDFFKHEKLAQNKELFELKEIILHKKIQPLLSSAWWIEQITRKKRVDVLSRYGEISTSMKCTQIVNGAPHLAIDISPNKKAYPPLLPEYMDLFNQALETGFKIVGTFRIGFPYFEDKFYYGLSSTSEAFNRIVPIQNFIKNELKAGEYEILKITEQIMKRHCLHTNWLYCLKYANETEKPKVEKAIAEMCDGDMIIGCYAYQINYFCTKDKAGNAGKKSIMSEINRDKLNKKFQINIGTPLELLDFLRPSLGNKHQ